ncbi:MAG TPA: PBP1A family penicillin-binding protein [Thermoanaerobaculia bacterium]|nr:PBP1A family penicillin-binding protein [Thermoanaerobaculia bacterium]
MEYEPLPATRSRVPDAPPARRSRRLIRWTWPVLAALLVGAVTGVGVAAAIHVPKVDSLTDYTPSLVTQLYDKNGAVFTTFSKERRVMLKESEMPQVMQRAVLASEDANFFRHGGIDAMGIGRAALADLRAGRVVEGASTISMQLARTLYLSRERTWRRKIEEAFVAVELEKNYSKPQILTLYLNLVNLGHGNYGVEAASRYYFDKPAAKLTLPEAAMLAGIIPAPSRFSPYRTPDTVLRNRNRVLGRMLDERFITRQQYENAIATPILVASQRQEEVFAPYFAEDVRKYLETKYGATGAASLYEGGLQVQTTLDPQIQRSADKAIRSGLLKLDHRRGWRGPVATIKAADLDSQQLPTWGQGKPVPGRWYQGLVLESDAKTASVKIGKEVYPLKPEGIAWTRRREPSSLLKRGDVAWFRFEVPEAKKTAPANPAAAKAGETPKEPAPAPEPRLMLEQQPRMEAAAVVIENRTGAVRAMVGGFDFERNKFNRVTQAKRQVGSSFKPFVYGAALEAGWTPSDTLLDAPTSFTGADGRLSYRPENYYHKHYGIVTLRRALEQSINVPAVKLHTLVGGRKVVDFARRLGIQTQLHTWPSVALGSADLVPLEVAAAYATIANQGTHIEPYPIEKVTTADGQVLFQHFPATYSATTPAVAYVLTHMMEGVIDHGTAYDIHDLPIDIAGKTGTTDDFSDAWFVAFTPRYTILTWVGYDVKKSLGHGMSGAVAALPMWRAIVEDGLATGWLQKGETFPVPPGVSERNIEYYSGLLSAQGGRTIKEAFVNGTEPNREYSNQWQTITNLPWYQQKAFYIPKEGENMPGKAGDQPAAGTPPPVTDPGPQDAPPTEPPPPGEEASPPPPRPAAGQGPISAPPSRNPETRTAARRSGRAGG